MNSPPPPSRAVRFLRLTAQLFITLIALIWSTFVLLVGIGDIQSGLKPPTTALMMVLFILPLAAITAAAWRFPRIGGLLAILLGAFVAWFFNHPAPQLAGALPLVAAGLLLALTPRRN